jgi:hypothetical protein
VSGSPTPLWAGTPGGWQGATRRSNSRQINGLTPRNIGTAFPVDAVRGLAVRIWIRAPVDKCHRRPRHRSVGSKQGSRVQLGGSPPSDEPRLADRVLRSN